MYDIYTIPPNLGTGLVTDSSSGFGRAPIHGYTRPPGRDGYYAVVVVVVFCVRVFVV